MKLSLIVPMYNVREYVRQCLDSLAAQTLDDMEVLMVNDGCTDDTPEIAAEYAERFPGRFILLNKPNGGLNHTVFFRGKSNQAGFDRDRGIARGHAVHIRSA